jgi:hypothetical protein
MDAPINARTARTAFELARRTRSRATTCLPENDDAGSRPASFDECGATAPPLFS